MNPSILLMLSTMLVLATCQAPSDSDSDSDSGSDSGTGGDGGSGDGGSSAACLLDDGLVPTISLEDVPLLDTTGQELGEAWFPLVHLSGLPEDWTGSARVCRDLPDGARACSAGVDATGPELRLPSTVLADASSFHIRLDDGEQVLCSSTARADIGPLDYDAAGLVLDDELPWSTSTEVDIPPTLLSVAIHRGTDSGAPAATVVSSVSTVEGLQFTALARFDAGVTDSVQPLPDGTGWYLLDMNGVLKLQLTDSEARLSEWDMIPTDQRCSGEPSSRSAPPPAQSACYQLSHGMVVDTDQIAATVLSTTPADCPSDSDNTYCNLDSIGLLGGGAIDPLWSYDDHIDEFTSHKTDVVLPYINGLGREDDVTCATWFNFNFEPGQTIPGVICTGVSKVQTVWELDASITHLPHDVEPIILGDGSWALVIADNTNGEMDSDGNRRPPRIQLYALPIAGTTPTDQLVAMASFDTGIHVPESYRFGSVVPSLNTQGKLVTVYVDGSGDHELGVIDLDLDTYTALARQALEAPGGTLTGEADRGARRVGSYALDRLLSTE